jgi:hypothetical protein
MGEIPNYITASDWAALGGLLTPFWIIAIGIFGFAGNMLFAQAIIPSLKATGELPDPRIVKLRPPLYAAAIASLALAISAVFVMFSRVGLLGEIYGRWFI